MDGYLLTTISTSSIPITIGSGQILLSCSLIRGRAERQICECFLDRGLPFNEGDVDGALLDYDNDGRLDISISRDSKYERNYPEGEQKAWFGLMRQDDDGRL